jgi:hypothetical protein
MNLKHRLRFVAKLLVVVLLSHPFVRESIGQDAVPVSPKQETKNAAEFKDFLDRVQAYIAVHKAANSSIPALKPTPLPEMITAHQQALARKIREARPHARRGDIFSEPARKAFRHAVKEEFQGPQGRHARKTIRQGEPLNEVHLRVNQPYPDGVPFTTVPPTLLLKFPRLPDEVAYRIVGQDLILLDVEANLVIDSIHEIFPPAV